MLHTTALESISEKVLQAVISIMGSKASLSASWLLPLTKALVLLGDKSIHLLGELKVMDNKAHLHR